MGNDVFCKYCEEEQASVYHDNYFVCEDCKREAEQDEIELTNVKKRNEEVSVWVKKQGDISLEEIMVKAYKDFVHFDDFGRVLHFYMKQKEPNLF